MAMAAVISNEATMSSSDHTLVIDTFAANAGRTQVQVSERFARKESFFEDVDAIVAEAVLRQVQTHQWPTYSLSE